MKKGMEWKYIFNTQPASLIWIAGGEGGWKLQILKRGCQRSIVCKLSLNGQKFTNVCPEHLQKFSGNPITPQHWAIFHLF